MERDNDGFRRRFEDLMEDGMRAFLGMTARAAESLHGASDRAIGRLDLSALERRLRRLHAELGMAVFPSLEKGLAPEPADPAIARLVADIVALTEEIDRRKTIP